MSLRDIFAFGGFPFPPMNRRAMLKNPSGILLGPTAAFFLFLFLFSFFLFHLVLCRSRGLTRIFSANICEICVRPVARIVNRDFSMVCCGVLPPYDPPQRVAFGRVAVCGKGLAR
jgi:hypothetical protein